MTILLVLAVIVYAVGAVATWKWCYMGIVLGMPVWRAVATTLLWPLAVPMTMLRWLS